MKSVQNYLAISLLTGLLLIGMVAVMRMGRGPLSDAETRVQAAPAAVNPATSAAADAVPSSMTDTQATPFQIDATVLGTVDLVWGAQGTLTDTWTTDELNTLADATSISIGFLLTRGAGDAVTGYVELTNSIVFTTAHSISTEVAGGTLAAFTETVTQDVGPRVSGSYAGGQLNLTSERIAYTTESGQEVQRQFRLTAGSNPGSESITGEYRETVWGLTLQPVTIGGAFELTESQDSPSETNRAPIANPQTLSTPVDRPKTITLSGDDADNDALTFEITADPTRGTLSGAAPNLVYTPNAGFAGSDSFTFRVNDGKVDSEAAAVSITVAGQGGNRAPTAGADAVDAFAGVPVSISVLANDSDPDGDPLIVTILQQPQHGVAQISGTLIVYTAQRGFSGVDSFTYTVTDSKGATASATVTVTVIDRGDGATIYLPVIRD